MMKIGKKDFYSLVVLFFIIGFFVGNVYHIPYKFIIKSIYQADYQKLMYKCDNAMRNQFISKARILTNSSKNSAKDLHAAEVALIDCHDYDVLRKKLMSLGLVSLDLSSMGLKAIEKEKYDLQQIVRIHEIRF